MHLVLHRFAYILADYAAREVGPCTVPSKHGLGAGFGWCSLRKMALQIRDRVTAVKVRRRIMHVEVSAFGRHVCPCM